MSIGGDDTAFVDLRAHGETIDISRIAISIEGIEAARLREEVKTLRLRLIAASQGLV